jgi:hypothetical protein
MLKKVTVAIALTGLMAGVAYAGDGAQTGINGSKHDMNLHYTADSYGRTCVFCHTPHNAATDITGAPLWNRTNTAKTPEVYVWKAPANLALNGGALAIDPLAGPTRLCASCHDGSIAVDSHKTVGATGGGAGGSHKLNSTTMIDLSVTHPVGFSYVKALNATNASSNPGRGAAELRPVNTRFLGPIATDALFDTTALLSGPAGNKTIENVLYNNDTMTCASCHEVHNTTNYKTTATGTGSYNYFLQAAEEGSALCITCHKK